ncbi:MAG: insulinase family protein, partial [candidate division Zixibacteria bacterium]|nr:insulinase family protein [candidate division Zixibacteria bacterium]
MRTIKLIFIFIFLLSGLSFAQHPRDMEFAPLDFNPPEPVRFETDNGIVVYFLEDHQLPVLTFSAYFQGGTVQDSPDKAGLSDITSTLLRSGGAGKRPPDLVDSDLDFVGISLRSNTGDEYFSIDMRLLKKDIETGFEILSDMLLKPAFDSSKLALELSNQIDQIKRQNDDARDIGRRVYYQTVYKNHPYGLYPTLESINSITRDDVIDWHKKFYSPDNCIMAISGDKTVDEIKTILNNYFGGWKKTNIKFEKPAPAQQKYKPGLYYAEKNINQANIRFGFLCMTDKNPDRFAMEVMNFALGGGGFSSRLTQKVRTAAGLAYSVGSYFYNRPLTGTLFGYCLTKANQLSQALGMMTEIISEVKENGITQEEMELAKESIINGYVFSYDTPSGLVNAKAMLELGGFPPDQ